MIEVKLKLEKSRGMWCARGCDAFGEVIRSSLKLPDTAAESEAYRELGLFEAKIVANGGHKLGGARSSVLTCDDLIELYLERGVSQGDLIKVKTVGNYWGRIPVAKVDESAMLEWERSMISRGLKGSTIKRYGTTLKAIINYGCKSKKLLPIELPTIGMDSEARVLNISNDDRDGILGCMEKDEFWFFTALAYTGARPKELINVRRKDVDLEKRRITLKSYKGKNGMVMSRTIPYSTAVDEVINECLRTFDTERDDYLFRMLDGTPWANFKDSTKAMSYRLYRAAKSAGYKFGVESGITLYAFRHTFGTNAGNSGDLNPFTLSSYMGHKNIQTTKENYFHGGVEDADMLVKGLG